MVKELVNLVKQHDKQVILTTHNPAILEGLTRYQGIFIDDRQPSFTPANARKKWIDSENRSFSLPCCRTCPQKK